MRAAASLVLVLVLAWLGGCAAGPPRCERHLVPINPISVVTKPGAGRAQP